MKLKIPAGAFNAYLFDCDGTATRIGAQKLGSGVAVSSDDIICFP
jgi:hypothetical protein